MMFDRIAKLVNAGIDDSLPNEIARRVRLCNQSAAILALSVIPALAVYSVAGSVILLVLGVLVIVAELAIIQLNRLGWHKPARIGFFLANDFLAYLCSNLVGPEAYFFLFYMAGLIAPFAFFTRQERVATLVTVAYAAIWAFLDVLLELRLFAFVQHTQENQLLARWLVVPSAFIAGGAFLILLLRENEHSEQALLRSRSKLETIVTSLNDTVFEINERLQIQDVWISDESKLPLPRSVYLGRKVTEFLAPQHSEALTDAIQRTLTTGESHCLDYQAPHNQNWFEVRVSRLPAGLHREQRVSVVLRNIQQERATRQRLKINDQIIQGNHDAILFLDRNGLIQSCNRSAERLYGYKEQELRGQSIFLFRTPDGPSVPDILQTLSDSKGWRGETRHRRRDGSVFDALLTISILHTDAGEPLGYGLISRDISEAKQAQNLLALSERRFKSMADHAPGVVYEWYTYLDGSAWGFNYVSPRIQEVLGVPPEAVIEDVNLLIESIHPEDFPAFRESVLEAARDCSRWNHQGRLLLKNGDIRWMHGISSPIDWDEDKVVFHGILMDVTQERLHRLELLAAKDKAEEASHAKAEFLSIMSHEIRTPLNAIIGLTHMLQEENPRPEQVDHLNTLRFSAENLLALINDILDFNKIEAGKIELEQVEFDLRQLLDSLSRTAGYAAQEKGLVIREQIDRRVPKRVLGDPTRLSQILSNLLSNAVKFTHQGLVELSVKRLDAGSDEHALLEFRVTDSGIGIANDKLERIFEYFTQADESITRSYGGTGLGLAITRALVELHNSQIQVESELGVGSTFFFTVDLACPQYHSNEVPFLLPVADKVDLQGRRILLVEDNPVNVMVAEKLLRKWGAEVDTAENGYEALEQIQDKDYDLVLMDIQMPLKDGYAATREIRALAGDKYRRLPIVALSAATTEDVQREALRAGMDGFLTKPINPSELKNKIHRYLQGVDSLTA